MKPRKTHETFVKEVRKLVGNEYTVIGQYVKAREPLTMRHNQCPEKLEWQVSPNNFKAGSRCPICSHKNKKRSVYRKKNTDKELLSFALTLLDITKEELINLKDERK